MNNEQFVRFDDAYLELKTHRWIRRVQVCLLKGYQGILGNVGSHKLEKK